MERNVDFKLGKDDLWYEKPIWSLAVGIKEFSPDKYKHCIVGLNLSKFPSIRKWPKPN